MLVINIYHLKIQLMKGILFSLMLLFTVHALADTNPDAVLGVWKNGTGKGHIQIYKLHGKYYGKIIWLKDITDETGKPKVDRKNSDPAQRNKPLIGLVMMRDFKFEGNNEYANGRIYNPSDGNEYKGNLKLINPNTLSVRGYVGFSWIGKTDTWVRVK
jgi:uncharacterized protein (DUF2147 family)